MYFLVEFHTADYLTYPNITVCHPRFFLKSKMQGKSRKIRKYNDQC